MNITNLVQNLSAVEKQELLSVLKKEPSETERVKWDKEYTKIKEKVDQLVTELSELQGEGEFTFKVVIKTKMPSKQDIQDQVDSGYVEIYPDYDVKITDINGKRINKNFSYLIYDITDRVHDNVDTWLPAFYRQQTKLVNQLQSLVEKIEDAKYKGLL